eukprot:1058409-Prorocentrum_minimum.AAC.1
MMLMWSAAMAVGSVSSAMNGANTSCLRGEGVHEGVHEGGTTARGPLLAGPPSELMGAGEGDPT